MGVGVHIFADMFGCSEHLLEKSDIVLKLLNDIVAETELTKVGETSHQFEPNGATAVVLLAESHISIHTWPDKKFASVDVFCCSGEEKATQAFELLVKMLQPDNYKKKLVFRD